jgi:hypothetical protein
MNREQIIKEIFSLKTAATGRGFDWPTNDDPETASTTQLHYFLESIKEFLVEEGIL